MLKLLYSALRIDPGEVEFSTRGFHCSRPELRQRLENAGSSFLYGYHAALEEDDERKLVQRLGEIAIEQQGFAYEGAGMALILRDGLSPWKKGKRFSHFIAGAAEKQIYIVYAGAGWGFARLPWQRRRIESLIEPFHPVVSWLVIDGYGFHEGYFHWRTLPQRRIRRLSEHARHVFHQGLGRSLWFIEGADPVKIKQTIAAFAPPFHNDAWSGIGLACAYAGGLSGSELDELLWHADSHGAALAQGAAFAAKARQHAGNIPRHTELACKAFCGMSAESAAALCDDALLQISPLHPCPYLHWRNLVQKNMPLYGRFGRHPAWVS